MACQMGPSLITLRLSLLPACPSRGQVCVHPSCFPRQHGSSVLSRRPPARWNTAMRATYVALLHGSSLRIELCCLDPSTLNRPDPPQSRAQPNFIALRLIWAAFAVRERLGDPRLVPGFRCPFCPGMPSATTPGTSTSTVPASDVDMAFAERSPARHSRYPPQSASRDDTHFGPSTLHTFPTSSPL